MTIERFVAAMNLKPDIVHFAGHGEKSGIMLVDDRNTPQVVPIGALKRLFKQHKDTTNIVILNSCYSAEQAEAISELGIYVYWDE